MTLLDDPALALVQPNGRVSRESLLALDSCLGVRQRAEALHAIFELEPASVESLLGREMDLGQVRCTRIGLEEMFIELAGGQS